MNVSLDYKCLMMSVLKLFCGKFFERVSGEGEWKKDVFRVLGYIKSISFEL